MQGGKTRGIGLMAVLVLTALAVVGAAGPANPPARRPRTLAAGTEPPEGPAPPASDSGTKDGGPKDAPGNEAGKDPCGGGRAIVDDYAALYPRDAAGAADAGTPGDALAFHHLIVLVPDPVETERSDLFDSTLEGVKEAVTTGEASDAGPPVSYVIDHSWLPWSGRGTGKRAARCWEREPGVLLYRPSGDPRRNAAFLVLLVGETATWGVQVKQMKAALAFVAERRSFEAAEDGGPQLRIVGPTFSGTAPSLAAVLRENTAGPDPKAWKDVQYRVVSGTATNTRVQEVLEGGAPSKVTYDTTTPNDEELLDAMGKFLAARGARRENAVVLAESQTAYGQGLTTSQAGTEGGSAWFEERTFPPGLASIREAYGTAVDSAGDAGAPPSPPALGRKQGDLSEDTPYVHGLELDALMRELSRDRARFVGLVATDPRDVLFLAERIRSELPDIRLFTLASDIRYLDPAHAGALEGMLVAHAERDGDDAQRSISLSNEAVRSAFLATRKALGGSWPRPGVEISIIGNGGLWEIGPDEGAGGSRRADAPHPISWKFVFVLTLALLAIVVAAVASPWMADRLVEMSWIERMKTTGFLRHRGSLWAHIGRCAHVDLAADDGLVTVDMLAIALCPPLLILASARTSEAALVPLGYLFELAALLLGLALLRAIWVAVAVGKVPGAHPNWSAIVLSLAAIAGATTGLLLAFGERRQTTFNLLSGASPVLAGLIGFLIMGIGLWCWRVRLRFLDSHRFGIGEKREWVFEASLPPIAQALGEADPRDLRSTGIAEVERRVLQVIRTPWTSFMAVPALVHLFLAVSLVAPILIKPPQTLEPGARNWLLVAFGIIALLPITGNLSRLLATWMLFRRLLHRIASHPAADALEKIPVPLRRNLTAQLASSGGHVSDLAYPLRALGHLAAADKTYVDDFTRCEEVAAAEFRYEAGAEAVKGEKSPQPFEGGDLADQLLRVACKANGARKQASKSTAAAIDELTATLVAIFVPRYVRHFRLFMPPLIFGAVLSTAMTSLYFIEPERLITSVIFVWVGAIALSGFVVYTDMDRDPVISGIGHTTAGAVTFDWGFVVRTVSWGLLPIGSLVATQYPALGSFVSSLFDSVSKGFR